MQRYNKAIVAVVGLIATAIFNQWGTDLGLPPGWPETFTMTVTPLAVLLIPNKG